MLYLISRMDSSKKENNGSDKVKEGAPDYGNVILTLKNCLLPEEKLGPTPSSLDGLDDETETDLRILGCELIQTAGILLNLPQVAMASAQVLFQRFYFSKSFVRQNFEVTGMGCLYLASKIEEEPRRIRDVINVYHHIKQVNSQRTVSPVILDQSYINLKYQVIKAERRVLKELGFCVHVKHPHKLIVTYIQLLGLESKKGLMQMAWNYMNDSLRTDVFVRYQPETIACACIYMSARKLKIVLPRSPSWFSAFRVDEADIQNICLRILKLYTRNKPKAEELEKRVQELCKKFEETRLKNKTGFNNITSGNNTPNSPAGLEKKISPKRSHSDRSLSPDSPRHKRYKRSRSRSYDKYKKSRSRRSRSNSPSIKSSYKEKRYRSRSRSYEREHRETGKYYSERYREERYYRDERYRRDDDRYRREDDYKYKKDDDYKYKKDDDRYRKDEEVVRTRKEDSKSRKDDESVKSRKDDDYRRDDDNVKHRKEEDRRKKEKEDDGHKHKKDKNSNKADENKKVKEKKHASSKHKSSGEKKKRKKHYDETIDDDNDIEIIHVKKEKKSR